MAPCTRAIALATALAVPAGVGAAAESVDRGGDAAAAKLGHPDFHPSPSQPVGFRGDWTGHYPAASPPLSWGMLHEPRNLLWQAGVGVGEASPILVGRRIYIVGDGVVVRCLSKEDGEVLWERRHHARKDDPAEEKAWRFEEYVLLHHEARSFHAEARQAERELAGLARAAERAGKPPDAARAAALKKLIEDSGRKAQPYDARREALGVKALGVGGALSAITYSIATPCSDGRFVYVFLPIGEVVCYDLDGNRRWLRWLGDGRFSGGWYGGQVAPSPLLADGKLVIAYDKLYCLEAATGRTLWAVPNTARGLPIASPVAGRAGDTWYVAAGWGPIYRLADSMLVYAQGPFGTMIGSPIFYDGLFCWGSPTVRVPAEPDGEARLAWRLSDEDCSWVWSGRADAATRGQLTGWHESYASTVQDDGLLYYHAERRLVSAIIPLPINAI